MNMAALLGILGASLLGSVHCAAMCGGFGCIAASQGQRAHAAYHAGRLAGYALLGAAAGAFGAALNQAAVLAGAGRVAAPAAGLLAMAWGGHALWRTRATAGQRLVGAGDGAGSDVRGPAAPFSTGSPRTDGIAAILRYARVWSPGARGLMLGLVTALLPCGWLWLFVTAAAGTGSALAGAAAMTLFWLGSVPLLAGASMAGGRLAARLGVWRPRLAALLLLAVGAMTVVAHARRSNHLQHDVSAMAAGQGHE